MAGPLSRLLQYFPKNRDILVQKLGGRKKLSKSVSGYCMTKKSMAIKGGGGQAFMALRENFFLVNRPLRDERLRKRTKEKEEKSTDHLKIGKNESNAMQWREKYSGL